MRGAASSMTVLRPATAREAIRMYARTPDALPLAGGTDLMVSWNLGRLNGRAILDLSRLGEWSRIVVTPEVVRVGALVTHAALQRHPTIRRRFPLLVDAAATVGGIQIQERGTLAGNIANASPAADTVPALAVYDAKVRVAGASGRRLVPILEMFSGPKITTLATGELIEAIELPIPARPPDRQFFRKVGTRAAQAISKIVAAGAMWTSRDGTVVDVRLVLGSMAPTVRRLRECEAHVVGRRLEPAVIADAASRVAADVQPIDDVRSTAAYRLATAERIVAAFLEGRA